MSAYERYREACSQYRNGIITKAELESRFPTGTLVPQDFALEDWGHVVDATGEDTGFLRRVGGRPIEEIRKNLEEIIECEGLSLGEGGLSDMTVGSLTHWPDKVRRILCYAVEGANEGHYVHVDVGMAGGQVKPLFLLKTFYGMGHALAVSNALTRAFYEVAR